MAKIGKAHVDVEVDFGDGVKAFRGICEEIQQLRSLIPDHNRIEAERAMTKIGNLIPKVYRITQN